jgi:opacity protein-like surface antigen
MKKLYTTLLLGSLGTLPLSLHAAAMDNPTGPYVGAGVGQFNTNIKHFDDVDNAIDSIRKSDDTTWKLFAGYRFLPYLGVEAAYIDFGKASNDFDATGSHGNYRVKLKGFAPSIIGRIPIGPIELFGKVGEYYYNVDTHVDFDAPGPSIRTKHSRNDFIWGGGVSAVVLSSLELRAEYEKLEIDNYRDSDALWLSAAWRF